VTDDPHRDDADAPVVGDADKAASARVAPDTTSSPGVRPRSATLAARASVPAPPARPWSRPPPPRDDTATTEWASAGHADDSVRTTEHRAAANEPVTEKLDGDELAAVRPPKPRRIERRDRADAGISGPWLSSDELPTTRMDSPREIAEQAGSDRGGAIGARNRREAKQIRSLFWVLVFAIVIAIGVLAGLHVVAR
jgi:hypothetical protein